MVEVDASQLAGAHPVDEGEDEASGDAEQTSFRDLLGPDCVIKRMDKDRNIMCEAKPEEMQHEMMTKAAAQKRLGACAEHVKNMSRKEKLDWALDLKDRANEFYAANNFDEASKLYNDCLVALDLSGTEEENADVAQKLQLPVCTNLAACMIENGRYWRCIEICDIALSVDSKNVKALYRRGLANYRMGNHAKAQPDFEAALRYVSAKLAEVSVEPKKTNVESRTKAADGGSTKNDVKLTEAEEELRSLNDVKRRVTVYLLHIREFSAKEKQSCQRMFERDLYSDRPGVSDKDAEPQIDDSDEAIEMAIRDARDVGICCCRRRPKPKQS
eukprot:TRINITY_DN20548_c0_g1_i1.p1 TRINITY_DN20548_c0_g1~~TRINITY_DN20548_c0_g1_i1.p1  ORF type:complete len:376 (+),score=78.87 TRINITY_DN20548_c0_g1_i1:142-1128(+)